MRFNNTQKLVKVSTIGAAVYLLSFGIAMAFFPIRPFWNDEWRLLYNIKFKDINGLWGTLDLLQECPRAYLTVLKLISSSFDYSYTSLRLPPLIIGFASVCFVFWLRKKLYPGNSVLSYLFVLILLSSQTFTDYLVQVKHYQMDIFVCLVALWQLLILLQVSHDERGSKYLYILLCITMLIVPYFSYIYPITVAPIFPIILLISVAQAKSMAAYRTPSLWHMYLPLILVTISIAVFYYIDVRHLMSDEKMYQSYIKMSGGDEPFIADFWKLFALVGSGLVFEIVFGILGLAAFCYSIYKLAKTKLDAFTYNHYFQFYAVLLVLLILFLLLIGKLHGGVARLTAYSVPSIAILIIALLEDLKAKYNYPKLVHVTALILFLGLFGNIISTFINSFTYPQYSNRINTYRNTSKALKQARRDKIPIMTTEEVLGDPYDLNAPIPGKISTNNITQRQIEGADTVAAEVVIKVNPEYKVWDTVPIYFMPDAQWVREYVNQLPYEFNAAVVGDGLTFRKIRRSN